jgi:hypothetical protein
MSSLSRKRAVAAAAGPALLCLGAAAGAAEVYYQPILTVATAYNTNLDLDPYVKQHAEGYFADASTNVGIATPTSDTLIQPRLLYNYYPSATYRDRLEGFLNLRGRYQWQRDSFTIGGFFDHRDDVNAGAPGAEVNTVNPGVTNTTPNQAPPQVGVVRNYLILDPTYKHALDPLSSIGFAGEYQGMRYSPSGVGTGNLSFNYYLGRLFYGHSISPRTDFQIGVYGSEYQSTTIDSHSTSGGLQLSGGHSWTEVLRSELTVQWQRTKLTETSPNQIEATANPWGVNFSTVYSEQTSSYRLTLGRTIYPSSAGGLYTTDQIRGQYDRDFTARLHFTGAARLFRDRTTTGVTSDTTRNYATGTVTLSYSLTQRTFVAGSYTYIYQKYRIQANSADANVAYLQFGYRGLGRR